MEIFDKIEFFDKKTYTLNYGVLYAFICILIVALVCVISMWVILAKKGDERRKFIVKDTCYKTFIIIMIIMVTDLLYRLFISRQLIGSVVSSAMMLGISSIIFIIIFFITKFKYGN